MHSLWNAALSAVVVAGWSHAALADPLSFIWNPSNVGLGLPATDSISATGIDVVHYADIVINAETGGFTESGVLVFSGFTGNVGAAPSGLNQAYSLYMTFSDSGFQGASPAPYSGNSTTGQFNQLAYTVWASPTGGVTVTAHPGGTPSIAGQGNAFPLFYGNLVSGTGTLTLTAPTTGGYTPAAAGDTTVTPCTAANQTTATGATCTGDETAFFNPTPGTTMAINVNGDGVSVLTAPFDFGPGGSGTGTQYAWLDIYGSTSGDVSFSNSQILNASQLAAPEPGTLMLLASGVMAVGIAGSRRKRGLSADRG